MKKSLLDARVAFGDAEIIESITLADQARVLESLGWHRQFCTIPLRCECWEKQFASDDEPHQAMACSERARDRIPRIGEFLHALSRAEGIPVLRVVLMLLPELPIDSAP